MSSNNNLMTIKEAAEYAKVNMSTIYKHIQSKRIYCESILIGAKEIKKVRKADIDEVYGLTIERNRIKSNQIESNQTNKIDANKIETNRIETNRIEINRIEMNLNEIITKAVQDVLENQKQQLMKPMEEQAMYVAGSLSKENKFLKERLETLIEENNLLREQMKALPGPPEEIHNLLQEKEKVINKLNKEKEEQIKEFLEEKETLKSNFEMEHNEKEDIFIKLQQEQEKLQKKENDLINLRAHLEEKEKEQLVIVEAWKKRVEELEKPWWKKIFR